LLKQPLSTPNKNERKRQKHPLGDIPLYQKFIVLWFAKLVCVLDVPYSGPGPEICKSFRFSLTFLRSPPPMVSFYSSTNYEILW